jgi:DNA-binding FadR family transcriptional regulator
MATKEPLSEQVFQWLLAQIKEGRWPVGTRLPAEPQLIAESGVCRSTLREGVRGLIHAGILEARHGSGTFVVSTTGIECALKRRLDVAMASEITEVRRALEVQAAGLAAARRSPEELAELEALLAEVHALAAARDIPASIEADLAFLLAVVRATHNGLLVDLYRDLLGPMRKLFVATFARGPFEAMLPTLHVALLGAIRAGDALAAEAAARAHLDRVSAILADGSVLEPAH